MKHKCICTSASYNRNQLTLCHRAVLLLVDTIHQAILRIVTKNFFSLSDFKPFQVSMGSDFSLYNGQLLVRVRNLCKY